MVEPREPDYSKERTVNQRQLRWLAEAEEVEAPVEVAEQFQVWTVQDEAGLVGLVVEIGWERWEALQDEAERSRK
jgi:hypothetical protein